MFAAYDKKQREKFLASLPKGQYYVVQLADPPYTIQKGLPTPMLISQGEGEGWNQDGVWRFRDDSYDPKGTKYTKVRVFRNPNE